MNFVKIFNKYEILGKGLNYIINNSNSLYNPYHNLNHNITVTVFCYHIGKSEKIKDKEMKTLLISALFHDFNHTGGKEKDSANIEYAKKGIKSFFEKEKINDISLDVVNEILDATEYPYKLQNEDLNILQKIIRDADFCQLFEPCRLQVNYLGLKKEFGATFKTQIANQKSFLDSLDFNTSFAKKLFKEFRKQIFEELEYLKKISEK